MKKKPEPKPKVLDKPLTDLEDWQAQYGEDYSKLIQHPAILTGLQLLNVRKLKQLIVLSPEEIKNNGPVILADVIGQLQHENDLFNLHQKREFKFPVEDQEEYLSPEQAAEIEQTIAKMREQTRRQRYGS